MTINGETKLNSKVIENPKLNRYDIIPFNMYEKKKEKENREIRKCEDRKNEGRKESCFLF